MQVWEFVGMMAIVSQNVDGLDNPFTHFIWGDDVDVMLNLQPQARDGRLCRRRRRPTRRRVRPQSVPRVVKGSAGIKCT